MAYIEVPDFPSSGLPLDLDTLNQILENIRQLRSGNRYFYQRGFADANYLINNTSFTDIDATNLACTLETFGGPVRITFMGAASCSGGGGMGIEFIVDGIPLSNDTTNGIGHNNINSATPFNFHWQRYVDLLPGEHTFKVQAKKSGTNNTTIHSNNLIQFEVMEI